MNTTNENQLEKVDLQNQVRSIDTVTNEIKTLCAQARAMLTCYIIEIGRRLVEAKGMLSHGEWGNWLRDSVNFSQSTANSYMRIFEEYGGEQISFFGEAKSQTLGNLPYTKALKLLAIPEDEREEFIESNNVEDISTRELERLIRERDEAIKERDAERERAESAAETLAELEENKKAKESLEQAQHELQLKVNELNNLVSKAKERENKACAELKELKNNPTVSEEVLKKIEEEAKEKARSEGSAELEAKVSEYEKKLREISAAKEAAEAREAASAEKLASLEKSIRMSNSEATVFKVKFEAAQKAMAEAATALEAVEKSDPELGAKFKAALGALAQKYVKGGGKE